MPNPKRAASNTPRPGVETTCMPLIGQISVAVALGNFAVAVEVVAGGWIEVGLDENPSCSDVALVPQT
jgi:hypothetical protein